MQNTRPLQRQRLITVISVLLLHGLALWGLNSGLLQRAVHLAQEVVMPVSVLTEEPVVVKPKPLPPAAPVKAPPMAPAVPVRSTPVAAAPPAPQAAAMPQAPADAAPAANAPTGVAQPAPVAAAVTPSTSPAPAAKVELPSSTADYLHNPKPPYPRQSERRGEQGTVILSVLVGTDGRAREVSLKTSSGFERLDQAAREAVRGWTFVPGKRNGVAVEMTVDVPIRFKPSE